MRERISTAMKDALKSGDKRRLSTLRLVTAAIKDRDIAARVDDKVTPPAGTRSAIQRSSRSCRK